jgi:hypothetical protein
MKRRLFLAAGAASVAAASSPPFWAAQPASDAAHSTDTRSELHCFPPAFAVVPVVGDGKWIWTEPPKDRTGYLEPRGYKLSIGVELQGQGDATGIRGSTPVPIEFPEQKIDEVRVEAEGCEAGLRQVGEGAAQLMLSAPGIRRGQTIKAIAHYKLTLQKQYMAYDADRFPTEQPEPPASIRKLYLQDSPGIQTSAPEVRRLHRELVKVASLQRTKQTLTRSVSEGTSANQPQSRTSDAHSWELAQTFKTWIHDHIEPKVGNFIGVVNALKRRHGDCEEMAGIFVALCRASGIPARLVWVPNHNWAEFYLTDTDGQGCWIPAHTSCYAWFGWTGVHELVIQKGDRVTPAHEKKPQRLLADWLQWSGKQPAATYVAKLTPLAPDMSTGNDAGPGARDKVASGEWKLRGNHPLDRFMRNG